MQEEMIMSLANLKARVLLGGCLCVVAFAMFAPPTASAQVTVTQVRVTMQSGARIVTYCDTTTAGCSLTLWNLTGGVALAPGQTLVLTQTALIPGVGGNFDTSDIVNASNAVLCNAATPCSVKVELNTGAGLATVYGPSLAGNPLNNGNADPGGNHQEAAAYVQVATPGVLNFTLSFGYADNVHAQGATPPPASCAGTTAPNCFPTPFDGSGGTAHATRFIGAGLGPLGASCTTNCYDAGALLITGVALPSLPGRMTGGGSVFTAAGLRVTHGFELHCDVNDVPNNLEINWDGGNNFHLTSLTTVTCIDNPAINPHPPNAPFDTLIATGVGTCNGLPAAITFRLTDAGEPGSVDTAAFAITGACTLNVSNNLDKGNQQAHND
jgi:hypothetical protein